MANLLDYLSLIEIVLMIMGVIIFLVLIFLLIWSVIKKRDIKFLLPFFLIPIIMVGFPSIKSIKWGNGQLEIVKLTAKLSENPHDPEVRDNLDSAITQFKSSSKLHSENALLTLVHAQYTLGKYDSAAVYVKKTLKKYPDSGKAKSLSHKIKRKLTIQQDFSHKITALDRKLSLLRQEQDKKPLLAISDILSAVNLPDYVPPQAIYTLAKSYAVTGNDKIAVEIINPRIR